MKETPEQAERRQQRERDYAVLSREERGIKLMRSWAHEFWLLRRREKAKFLVIVTLLGAIILLEVFT